MEHVDVAVDVAGGEILVEIADIKSIKYVVSSVVIGEAVDVMTTLISFTFDDLIVFNLFFLGRCKPPPWIQPPILF